MALVHRSTVARPVGVGVRHRGGVLLTDLCDLVFPTACAACGVRKTPLCAECAASLADAPARVRPGAPDAPVCWSGGAYAGALRATLLAYKERGRRELTGPLADVATRTILTGLGTRARPRSHVFLVPIPSTRRAARARGGDHVRRLAAAAAGRLRRVGVVATVAPVLAVRGHRIDSVGLSAAARRANIAGTLAVRDVGAVVRLGHPVVLIDDLVTTGATLSEATRVLAVAGVGVTMAAVLASTKRRSA